MTSTNDAGTNVEALIQQREQLRAWIAKLDEVKTEAPSRVAQRVRADYEDRLRRVTEELGTHREEIERELEAVRAELDAAEERRGAAADALEETRLRHLIGELDAGAWDEARPRLEGDLADADGTLERTRAEVERLTTLVADVAEAGPEPEPAADAAPALADPVDAIGYAPPAAEEPAAEAPAAFAEPEPEPEPAAAAPVEDVVDEDLASWLNDVEAQASRADGGDEPPAPQADAAPPAGGDVDNWDPFANEFGSAPASPSTQPGDASDDLPWLDAIDNAAGKGWTPPAETDELAFLKDLETGPGTSGGGAAPPPVPPTGGDLAADDLAFLEELDRAISGGAGRAPATPPPPATPSPAPSLGLTGGSGDGGVAGGGETRKKGESLLCKECGAINEPQAWYCEICGSEL